MITYLIVNKIFISFLKKIFLFGRTKGEYIGTGYPLGNSEEIYVKWWGTNKKGKTQDIMIEFTVCGTLKKKKKKKLATNSLRLLPSKSSQFLNTLTLGLAIGLLGAVGYVHMWYKQSFVHSWFACFCCWEVFTTSIKVNLGYPTGCWWGGCGLATCNFKPAIRQASAAPLDQPLPAARYVHEVVPNHPTPGNLTQTRRHMVIPQNQKKTT